MKVRFLKGTTYHGEVVNAGDVREDIDPVALRLFRLAGQAEAVEPPAPKAPEPPAEPVKEAPKKRGRKKKA